MKILSRPIIILLLAIAVAGCSFWGKVDRDLVGTEWRLVELNGRPPIPTLQKEITLKITSDGLQGYGGCNQFGNDGKFFMRSGKLSIKSVVSSAKSCGAEIDEQETAFYRALRNAATYRVREDRLELNDTNGKLVLLFERVDDEERGADDNARTHSDIASLPLRSSHLQQARGHQCRIGVSESIAFALSSSAPSHLCGKDEGR